MRRVVAIVTLLQQPVRSAAALQHVHELRLVLEVVICGRVQHDAFNGRHGVPAMISPRKLFAGIVSTRCTLTVRTVPHTPFVFIQPVDGTRATLCSDFSLSPVLLAGAEWAHVAALTREHTQQRRRKLTLTWPAVTRWGNPTESTW